MGSVGKWTRRSTEDLCLYSLLKVYGISWEMDQQLHRGLLLILLTRSAWNQKGNGPELHRRFIVVLSIKSVWNQCGNGRGAPLRTHAYIPYKECMKSIRKWTRSAHRTSAHTPYWKCIESVRKWTRSSPKDLPPQPQPQIMAWLAGWVLGVQLVSSHWPHLTPPAASQPASQMRPVGELAGF